MVLPTVTVAIPTFRRLAFLKEAVASAMGQDYPNLQIILSDNHSGDGTAEFLHSLRDPRVLVLCQSDNLGMVGNWNACLDQATGEWFLVLSDDDLLDRTAIRRMIEAALSAPEPERIGFVYCLCRTIDADGSELACAPRAPAYESAIDFGLAFFERRRVIFPCGAMLRTADLRSFGGYVADRVQLGCDAIAWSEAALKRGETACVNQWLSSYRVHGSNLTSTTSVKLWMHDLQVVISIWRSAFDKQPAASQQSFDAAASSYYTWFMAAVLAQSGRGLPGTLRSLGRFIRYRSLFTGAAGSRNFMYGIARLLLPESLHRSARAMRNLLRTAVPLSASRRARS